MSGVSTLRSEWEPRVLSIVRIVAGLLFMEHGLTKLFSFPPTPTHVPSRDVPAAAGSPA